MAIKDYLTSIVTPIRKQVIKIMTPVVEYLTKTENRLHEIAANHPPVSVFFGDERFPDHAYNHVHNWKQNTLLWKEGTIRKCVAEDPNYRCGATQIHTSSFIKPWIKYHGDISIQEINVAYKKDMKDHYENYEEKPDLLDKTMRAVFEPISVIFNPIFFHNPVIGAVENWINKTYFSSGNN